LNRINRIRTPSPQCCICQQHYESITHFLVWCPSKLEVWRIVWNTLFHRDPLPSALIHFLFTGDRP
ncbi:hypothetical protein BJV82DRAFT_486211, partial [Fennellomyces sp. T-0311]